MRRRLRALLVRLLPHRAQFLIRRLLFKLKLREPEIALVRVLARADRAFLDVGAHKGVYCLAALGHYREVIGVEPFPPMSEYLRAGLSGKARILSMALSNRQGSMPLRVPVAGGQNVPSLASLEAGVHTSQELREVMVDVGRIDDLDLPALGLVKIDVEGHELEVLEGARERLAQDRPALIIEIEEGRRRGCSDRVLALLQDLGYEAFYLEEPRLQPLAGRRIAEVQGEKGAGTGRYMNNFIFVHRDDGWTRSRLREQGRL